MDYLPTVKQSLVMIALSPIVTLIFAWMIKSFKRFPSDARGFIQAFAKYLFA